MLPLPARTAWLLPMPEVTRMPLPCRTLEPVSVTVTSEPEAGGVLKRMVLVVVLFCVLDAMMSMLAPLLAVVGSTQSLFTLLVRYPVKARMRRLEPVVPPDSL